MDSNSGILSENTKANYTERYDSLLKMKNHVSMYAYDVKQFLSKIIRAYVYYYLYIY